MNLKREEIVYINAHNSESDVACGRRKPRRNGGEFYRFIHWVNSNTAFVSRPLHYVHCCEKLGYNNGAPWDSGLPKWNDNRDIILVPIETIVQIKRAV